MALKHIIAGTAIIGGIALATCTEVIPQGHVGAVYDKMRGGIQDEILTEGLNFVPPWAKVNEFPVSTETVYMTKDKRDESKDNEEITIGCSDGSLKADLSFRYHFNSDDVSKIQKKYRGKSGEQIMQDLRGQMIGWINIITKNYSTMDAHLAKKDEINTKLLKVFNERAEKYGVTFEEITIMNTRPSEEVSRAIEKRQKIAQELEQQKLSLEKSEIRKQEAEIDAERKLIEAKGEKEANEARTSGLTDAILKQQAIEKWNGQLPQVTSDNVMKMVN